MDDHWPLGTAMILQDAIGLYGNFGDKNKNIKTLLGEDDSEYTFLNDIVEIARGTYEHHEDCAGSGFLYQKTPNEISLVGKILQYADMFDALTEKRGYKDAKSLTVCLDIMKGLPDGAKDSHVATLFENYIVPFVKEHFGENNTANNLVVFLEHSGNDQYDKLRVDISSLNNYSYQTSQLLPELKACDELLTWADEQKCNRVLVSDLESDNNNFFKNHFENLDLIARIETLSDTDNNSNLPLEVDGIVNSITRDIRISRDLLHNLSDTSKLFLKSNVPLSYAQDILLNNTKLSYEKNVPYLIPLMSEKSF